MRVDQFHFEKTRGWDKELISEISDSAQLVLVFGDANLLKGECLTVDLKKLFPKAKFFGCSTAGEIVGIKVYDDTLVATAIQFDYTSVIGSKVQLDDFPDSYSAGKKLLEQIPLEGLAHLFVLSDGLKVNGTELVRGLSEKIPKGVTITGGLAGDGDRFRETFVTWGEETLTNSIVAIGFYGNKIKIGYASLGGWDTFGPQRLITKSNGNVLYEMDGQSALELYKKYLGEHATGLPATGLLFPLSLKLKDNDNPVVRTILAVDESAQSMTFAGDIPQGSYASLMKANFDRLIDGAEGAAKTSYQAIGSIAPDFAILISCVGRKLVLKQRIEEEVESVRAVLGERAILSGFYSYGEISPFTPNARCELHNQTMTITAFVEE